MPTETQASVPAEWTIVSWLRSLLRAIWVARISVASVALSWIVLGKVQQAQDLFLDIRPWYYWLLFYVCAAVFWLIPVHHSARSLLHIHRKYIGIDTKSRFYVFVEYLPRLIALLGFGSIAVGQFLALDNVPHEATYSEAASKARSEGLQWFLVTLALLAATTVVMFWPGLSQRVAKGFAARFPRLVGASYLLATAIFGSSYIIPPDDKGQVQPGFFTSRAYDEERLQTNVAALVLTAIFVLCLYLFLLRPLELPPGVGRATMLVIILGAWIPLLHFLTFLSWRLRLPVTTVVVAVFALLGTILFDNHDLRLLPAATGADIPTARQIGIEQAVAAWRNTNCDGTRCPRPIIVVAEGGASRSAFFTAGFLGHLQDRSMNWEAPKRRLDRQIFAISGVSGGSLGAAAYVAAVRVHQLGAFPKELTDLPGEDLSFLDTAPAAPAEAWPATFKGLLERFLAGDFLSPTMARLSFGDFFRFYWIDDRAAILEQSWEHRWNEILGNEPEKDGLFSAGLQSFAPTNDQWMPLLLLNGTSTVNGRRIITSPLRPTMAGSNDRIFTDSVDLNELRCVDPEVEPNFRQKPARREKGYCACTEADGRKIPVCDIRLSTAVTNSARFPYISPRGNIRNGTGFLVDYVVDGGHFDFFGITTAIELARVLQSPYKLNPFLLLISSDPELDPIGCAEFYAPSFVKAAVNVQEKLPWLKMRSAFDKRGDTTPLPSIAGPLSTLMQTRVSRSFHQAWTAGRTMGADSVALARVCPVFPERQGMEQLASADDALSAQSLSMSWWLSHPVLDYLNRQITAEHNRKALDTVERLLSDPPTAPPSEECPTPDSAASSGPAASYKTLEFKD
jgi:hypothetical protein